jgi:hypothetical protein
MLNVVMARGKRSKKGGDFEVQKQNVASSERTIGKENVDPLQARLGEQNVAPSKSRPREQNVAPSKLKPREQNVVSSKLRIDESNNFCGLELIMVIIYNSNDEITPNTDWEFRPRNGGLNCFKIYIH